MIGSVQNADDLRARLSELRDLLRHKEYAKADDFAEELEREVALRLQDDESERQSRRWPW